MAVSRSVAFNCDQCGEQIEAADVIRLFAYYNDETPMLTLHFCSPECQGAFLRAHPEDDNA